MIFITSRLAAARKEVELITEHNSVRNSLIEQQAYQEGQLRTIERLVSSQEEMLEMRRNFSNYLLDITFLILEGEEIKPYLDLVKDTGNTNNDDEDED